MIDTPTYYELKSIEKDGLPKQEGMYVVKTKYGDEFHLREFTGTKFTNYDGYSVTHWLEEVSLLSQVKTAEEILDKYDKIFYEGGPGMMETAIPIYDAEKAMEEYASQFRVPSSTQEGMKEEAIGFARWLTVECFEDEDGWHFTSKLSEKGKTIEQMYDLYQSQKQKA